MSKLDSYRVTTNALIREALRVIDSGIQIALVVDADNKLLGTVTDGDIRRALLNGIGLDTTIENIYFKEPLVCSVDTPKNQILKLALDKGVKQVPLVDENGVLVDIELCTDFIKHQKKKNKVILMAGGLGQRLRPLTENTPKPMLKVGDKPILETILENFKRYGFVDIYISVNYLSKMIKDYFGDGSDFGVKITYIEENERLGTAGALSLIQDSIHEPFFVMNGDLLTGVNFEHLLDYHLNDNAEATMCVREYEFQVPFGVVKLDDNAIKGIDEKPLHRFFVSAGIYVLSPDTLKLIPKNSFYDMPTLFEELIQKNQQVVSFPLREYWIDIGHLEDYHRANEEYKVYF